MKDHHFLFNALEQIDDDLIREAAQPPKKRNWIPTLISAAAACLVLAIGCSLFLRPSDPNPQSGTLHYAENLWQREDFQAYSLSYRTETPSLLTYRSPSENRTSSFSSKQLLISTNQTIKFETLIAQRYAVYYSSTGYPIFYDTLEDREVDLQERILGDTTGIFKEFMKSAEIKANELAPGMLQSETNRRLFWEYLYCVSMDLPLQDVVSQIPDFGYLDAQDEWADREDAYKVTEFWSKCWTAFVKADSDLSGQLYSINILAIDATGGQCILKANDLYGNGCGYLVYDITTDTFTDLPNGDDLLGTMQTDGYQFRFSSDGSIATIAFPKAHFSGDNLYLDLTQRFTIPSEERYVGNYQGEELGVFFLKNGKAQKFNSSLAASELFISQKNQILYYKRIEESQSGKSFHASDAIWFNRLNLFARDTDRWVFHTVSSDHQVSSKAITLQGNFVRFAAEESIVIMEQGGKYYAYSLIDGNDTTEAIKAGQVTMFAHEQMTVYLENGNLYRKNIFRNSAPELICQATNYALSDDSAFVFAYTRGDRHLTCYNVATLENCTIAIDQQLCDQLLSSDSTVLQMNYNAEENTLLISYYTEADQNSENISELDFYQTLEQINDSDPDDHFPNDPVVITDYRITEEIMNIFRDSVYRYGHPDGVLSWETYYPEFLSVYEDLDSICEKLGLDISTIELDVNGTQFVLYQDEDETLTLTFYQFWGLFDYDDRNAGFEIRYNGESVCSFTFIAPDKGDSDAPHFELPFDIPPVKS